MRKNLGHSAYAARIQPLTGDRAQMRDDLYVLLASLNCLLLFFYIFRTMSLHDAVCELIEELRTEPAEEEDREEWES